MPITQDSVRHCDSGGLKSRLELTDFSSIYENAQVVYTVCIYWFRIFIFYLY